MEEEEIQTQPPCKFSRVSSNGRSSNTSKIGQKGGSFENQLLYPPDEEEDVELNKRPNLGTIVVSAAGGGGGDSGGAPNRLRGWHHSSRIIRVSRASGGKDRHSKVWTSKGLRDRRVRLSVTTAIQFYDLQDRLGYDQPSKAVEWLIKAAADSINELPSLNGSNFPDTPKQLSDEKGFDSADVELEDPNFSQNQNQNQHFSLSKSACSSTSDTSKGSGLSLSRPDVRVSRVKARERARERTAKEKEKESHESSHIVHHQNVNNPISQNSTFTELLTGGISSVSNNNNNSAAAAATASPGSEANLFHNHNKGRQWPNLTPMDYFSTGLLGPTSSRTSHHSSGFQLGNSIHPQAMTMSIPPYSFSGENNHQEQLQHFPFLSDHLIPVATTTQQQQQQQGHGGDYNLNFTISSSGLSGFNRGTLQSNSSSSPSSFMPHHHHLQRFSSSSIDGSSNLPFFIGATAAPQPPPMENHHHNQQHHHHQFPPGLQLYGDGSRHSDHKGKGKN